MTEWTEKGHEPGVVVLRDWQWFVRRAVDKTAVFVFFAMVVLAALPMGGNRDWAWAPLCVLLGLIAIPVSLVGTFAVMAATMSLTNTANTHWAALNKGGTRTALWADAASTNRPNKAAFFIDFPPFTVCFVGSYAADRRKGRGVGRETHKRRLDHRVRDPLIKVRCSPAQRLRV